MQPKEYALTQLEGSPKLLLLPATEANRPYHAALLKRNVRNARRIQAGRVDPQFIAEQRNEDRELYSKFVAKGWSGVTDDEGKESAFSPAECHEFFKALPDWIFDDVRAYAMNTTNWVPEGSPTPDEVAEHSGN